MKTPVVRTFPDREHLAESLANCVADLLTQAVKRLGRAVLAVSGGSTPGSVFDRLSQSAVPWERVVVTLVDERWVDPSAQDSNERLVRTRLLRNRAAASGFVGLKTPAARAADAEAECERRFSRLPRPFAALLLGMGRDGHTASLFPGSENLSAATEMGSGRICVAVTPPAASHERMTLTLPAILDAERIFLHITGQDKRLILQKAMEEGPAEDMPIRFILRQRKTPMEVFWAP